MLVWVGSIPRRAGPYAVFDCGEARTHNEFHDFVPFPWPPKRQEIPLKGGFKWKASRMEVPLLGVMLREEWQFYRTNVRFSASFWEPSLRQSLIG